MENQTDNFYIEEVGSEINCDMEIAYRKVRKRRKVAIIAAACVIALVAVITEGNKIESTRTEEEKGPVDVGLEEENAKKQPGN